MWNLSPFSFPCVLFAAVVGLCLTDDIYKLPDDILLGAGTSAFQTEGAYNEDGKGKSFLDYLANDMVFDEELNATFSVFKDANVASDSYHHVEDDVAIMKELKINAYRFSLSWTRLLPNGTTDYVNDKGVAYYNNLLQKLQANNIEPVVSLLHFDNPLQLTLQYGWTQPEMIDAFVEYARFAFETFGDKITYWVSVNEPDQYCRMFLDLMVTVGVQEKTDNFEYMCARNTLLAHAKAYYVLQEVNAAMSRKGHLGISATATYGLPLTDSFADRQASTRYNAFNIALYFDPLVFGDFPAVVRDQVAKKSKEEKRAGSRLPEFNTTEQDLLRNTVDFFGLNMYYGISVSDARNSTEKATKQTDKDAEILPNEDLGGFAGFDSAFSRDDSWIVRENLLYMNNRYGGGIPIFITENGYLSKTNAVDDQERQAYYSAYLRELTRAINEYQVNVKAYFAWSFIDSFEWSRSYSQVMGLVKVDVSSANRTRTIRDSARILTKIMEEKTVPYVAWPSSSGADRCVVFILPSILPLLSLRRVFI